MDYKSEITRILKLHELDLKDFSKKIGASYGYIRFIMKPSEIRTVLWQRAFLFGYELGKSVEVEKKSTATQ